MRETPNGQGLKLVEREDGIDAIKRFQFHENEEMRNMANGLVDKYTPFSRKDSSRRGTRSSNL